MANWTGSQEQDPEARNYPMDAMNAVRLAISVFVIVLIGVSASGWIWAGSHQSPVQSTASRVVLTLCIVAGVIGLRALWRTRSTR